MRVALTFGILSTILTCVNAYTLAKTIKSGDPGSWIADSSYEYVTEDLGATFGLTSDDEERSYVFSGPCTYEPAVGTMLLASANKYGEYSRKFNTSVKSIREKCAKGSRYEWDLDQLYDAYENATKYAFQLDPDANYTGQVFYVPLNLTVDMIASRYNYAYNNSYNFDAISLYCGMFYLFFVLVFLIHGVANLMIRFGIHTKFNHKLIRLYRSRISMPALFNGKHTEESVTLRIFSTLIPTRLETVVIFFFTCLNVLLTTINYNFSSTVATKRVQLYTYAANRTGLLSFGLIPLLIIFSGRNNLLISLTGIPYTSFIVYHKCVARFMFVHAVLHSAFWTGIGIETNSLAAFSRDAFWQWGIVATILGGLICFQAFHMFRKMSYEVFLCLHVVLAALFIVGCFYHCVEIGYLEWIFASCAIWVADRLTRLVRILLFGIRDAEIKYISDGTFRMTVKCNRFFDPFPGAYAFVYFMTPLKFWQSHPFTVIKSVREDDSIVCYIKVKGGITKSLFKELEKTPDMTQKMKVCVEGPYGHRSPVEKYDSVLLLGGGNGIPGLFAHAVDLEQLGLTAKKRVQLVWATRNPESLCWFKDELKYLAQSQVQIDVYITGKTGVKEKHPEDSSGKSQEKVSISSVEPESVLCSLSAFINVHYQRPDVEKLIKTEMLQENGPSVAVVSCGPPKMVDLARRSVAAHLVEAKGRVDLYEELQVW